MTAQDRYEAFCKELGELCAKHGVCIAASGYDTIYLSENDSPDQCEHGVYGGIENLLEGGK